MRILNAKEIRLMRRHLDFTMQELADKCHVTKQTISHIENKQTAKQSLCLLISYVLKDELEDRYPDKDFDKIVDVLVSTYSGIEKLMDTMHKELES